MLISTNSARGFWISIPSTPSSSLSRQIGKACTMPKSGFFKGFSADKDKPDAAAKIKVVVRKRPLNKRKIAKKEDSIIMIEQNSDSHSVHETKLKVFGPSAKQKDLYNQDVIPIVNKVLEGFYYTIFAYGQLVQKKTFTMKGECISAKIVFTESTSSPVAVRYRCHTQSCQTDI